MPKPVAPPLWLSGQLPPTHKNNRDGGYGRDYGGGRGGGGQGGRGGRHSVKSIIHCLILAYIFQVLQNRLIGFPVDRSCEINAQRTLTGYLCGDVVGF
jgi:hypothetical protein